MMGYFDALLRAGSLLGDQRSVANQVARTEADPLGLESEQFDRTPRSADAAASSTATPLYERTTAAPEPTPGAAEQIAARTDAQQPAGLSEQRRDATAVQRARVRDRPSEGGGEDIGRTLVQAALRWVAAAPTQAQAEGRPSGEHADGPSASQPGGEREAFAIDAQATQMRAILQGPVEASSQQDPLDTSLPAARILCSEPAHPARAERAVGQAAEMAAPAHRPAASKAREETFEVSIGAIHVRVDAPQTRAGTRTPTPKAAPSLPGVDRAGAHNASHNSRLARRGLRRV